MRRKQRPFKTDFATAGDAEAAFETVDVDAYDAPVVPSPVIHVTSVTDRVMEHSKSHPRMLKSNATSHVWAFGAIAELLDKYVYACVEMVYALGDDGIDAHGDNTTDV